MFLNSKLFICHIILFLFCLHNNKTFLTFCVSGCTVLANNFDWYLYCIWSFHTIFCSENLSLNLIATETIRTIERESPLSTRTGAQIVMSSIVSSLASRENRSYGGKAGIWLKKRRRSRAFGSSNSNNRNVFGSDESSSSQQSKIHSVTPIVTDEGLLEVNNPTAKVVIDKKEDHTPKQTRRQDDENKPSPVPPVQTMIGWDDVLCRPIYKITSDVLPVAENITSSCVDRNVTDDDNDDGGDIQEEALPSLDSHVKSSNDKKRSRQGYGARKRVKRDQVSDVSGGFGNGSNKLTTSTFQVKDKNKLNKDDDINNVQDKKPNEIPTDPNVIESGDSKKVTSSSMQDNENLVLSSPQPARESSICLTLDSAAKGTPAIRRVTDFGEKLVSKPLLDLETISEEIAVTTNTDQKNQSKKRELSTESSSLLKMKGKNKKSVTVKALKTVLGQEVDNMKNDYDSEKIEQEKVMIRQPSSHTSMDAARAFFEHLDSTQTLVIDSNSTGVGNTTPRRPGTRCVRTRRKTDTCSTLLKEEYNTYVEATKGNGVTPLSIQEYAVNRGNYFRKSQVYEGFLDE